MEFKFEYVKTDKKVFAIPVSSPEIINARFDKLDALLIVKDMMSKGYTIITELMEEDNCGHGIFYVVDMISHRGQFRLKFIGDEIRFFPRTKNKKNMKYSLNDLNKSIDKILS